MVSHIELSIVPPVPDDILLAGIAPEARIVQTDSFTYQVAWAKRLRLKIENRGDREETVVLVFEGKPAMMDYPYLRDAPTGEWKPIAGVSDGSRVWVSVKAPPGRTDFSVSPPYTREDCDRLAARIADDPRVTVSAPGKSAEGRNLWLFTIAEAGCRDEIRALKRNCLIAARAHPWETAGSYCIEGILDYLLSDYPRAAMYLQMFDVHICPMMDPDGVANGIRRHTPDGADLNRDMPANRQRAPGSENAPELVCHFRVIDELKPDIYCQIHNMNQKHRDCVLGMEPGHAESFQEFMPRLPHHLKLLGFDRGAEGTVPKYCQSRDPACVACTFEFPWFGRTTRDMRELGPLALEALLNTKIRADQLKSK